MAGGTVRVTITLPSDLLARIKATSRNVSGFLAEAAAERLAQEQCRLALSNIGGAWSDEDHPDLCTADDIARYVAGLRRGWDRRG